MIRPEQHHHNIIPVEHKTFDHRNDKDLNDSITRERAQFQNQSVTHDTTHSTETAPTVMGERIHHHVHEHVQPVIQKETIAPKVVHTTVPIHETHHAAGIHHGTSVLPAKTLDEFTASRGILEGRDNHKIGEYEGCPKPYNKQFQQEQLEGDRNMHILPGAKQHESGHHGAGAAAAGLGAAGVAGAAAHHHRRGSNSSSSSSSASDREDRELGTKKSRSKKGGILGTGIGAAAGAGAASRSGRDTSGTSGTSGPHDSNLLNKLDVSSFHHNQ